jgi:hypothetical protein
VSVIERTAVANAPTCHFPSHTTRVSFPSALPPILRPSSFSTPSTGHSPSFSYALRRIPARKFSKTHVLTSPGSTLEEATLRERNLTSFVLAPPPLLKIKTRQVPFPREVCSRSPFTRTHSLQLSIVPTEHSLFSVTPILDMGVQCVRVTLADSSTTAITPASLLRKICLVLQLSILARPKIIFA